VDKLIYTKEMILDIRLRMAVLYTDLSLMELMAGDDATVENHLEEINRGLLNLTVDIRTQMFVTCPLCDGFSDVSMHHAETVCPACNGELFVTKLKAVEILKDMETLPIDEELSAI